MAGRRLRLVACTIFLLQGLNASAAKPSCKEAFAETSSFLSSNASIVSNFPEQLKKNRDAVTAFAARVEHASQVVRGCLAKEPKSATTLDAYLMVDEFRSHLANWISHKQPILRAVEIGYQERLLKAHARAIDALARVPQ